MHVPSEKCAFKINPPGDLCVLFGIVEGHHNYSLFNPQTSTIYLTHYCSLLYYKPFLPTYCPTKMSPTAPTFPPSLVLMDTPICAIPTHSAEEIIGPKNESWGEV
ncbi:hypothetical protein O181_025066 [Austropuccinia psidii MF-1]|uniref:Uncharacterized protein n=1 Tax=Austropuccinia psidii MF-1 TaxID=1389203 RepID=A0A9Q3GZ74_9BASI|nr:hypothetical protein [Austropuccinia psidii MF-1]